MHLYLRKLCVDALEQVFVLERRNVYRLHLILQVHRDVLNLLPELGELFLRLRGGGTKYLIVQYLVLLCLQLLNLVLKSFSLCFLAFFLRLQRHEQLLDIIHPDLQLGPDVLDNLVCDLLLLHLPADKPLFDGVADNELVDDNVFLLADTVCSRHRLLLNGGVPMRADDYHALRALEVETHTTDFERYEQSVGDIPSVELVAYLLPPRRRGDRTVYPQVPDLGVVQQDLDKVQLRGVLCEYQRVESLFLEIL